MHDPPSVSDQAILEVVGRYYSDKLRAFGATPRGVDWNSADSQNLRFSRLLQIIEGDREVSLNDYGCGYGALVDYLTAKGDQFTYVGFDVSESMIASAQGRHATVPWCSFTTDPGHLLPATYTLASGIFNVKLDYPSDIWREYVLRTLTTLDALSVRGFAFNMLSTYSDLDRRRADLFYADPLQIFDLCKRRMSSRVSLLHDYPLYEFTILVKK